MLAIMKNQQEWNERRYTKASAKWPAADSEAINLNFHCEIWLARTRAIQHNRAQSFYIVRKTVFWMLPFRWDEGPNCALNRYYSVPSDNSNINTLAIDWLHKSFFFGSILLSTLASFGNFTCFRCAISSREKHLPFEHVAQFKCVQ